MRYALYSLFVLALVLSGCTIRLWMKPTFEETIQGIYLDANNSELLVAGESNAYRFPIDDRFEQILMLSREIKFHPYFWEFELHRNGSVSGELRLLLAARSVSDIQASELKDLGFEGDGVLTYVRPMEGSVYDLEGDLPLQTFDEEYQIQVRRPPSGIATIGKIVATPVTIAIDGVHTVPAGLLLVLIMSTDSWGTGE